MRVLLFLLLLACTGRAFDTVYDPDKHWIVATVIMDDRADSQMVNVCNEFDVSLTIAPYESAGGTILDIDSTDFDGDGSVTKGEYNRWLIGWAAQRGATFADHDQGSAPEAVAAGGLDSMYTKWAGQKAWLDSYAPMASYKTRGFIWVGHQNTPQLRTAAKVAGYDWTRGDVSDSKDLYIGLHGWNGGAGAVPFMPTCMTHTALVPSLSVYRLNSAGSSFPKLSTVGDSAGWWDGVWSAFNTGRKANQFWVINPHPGWEAPWAETAADTIATTWAHTPDGDSLRFATRRGTTGRNDISAFQLSYILKRLQVIDDSLFAADGVRRICFVEMTDFMANPLANFRTDNSDDPDDVSDWSSAESVAETTNSYWESNDGLYAKDPALNRDRVIYVDGTSTRTAGNGTRQSPMPATALPYLFNCKVEFTGHSVGDTLILPQQQWLTANVDVNGNGLTLIPRAANNAIVRVDSVGTNAYFHNIKLRNFTVDGMATTATQSLFHIGPASTTVDSLRVTDILLKGITFKNAEVPVYIYSANRAVVDSCFFRPGLGAITDNGATWALEVGQYAKNTLVRNNLFDMNDCGGNAGSGQSGAIQMMAHGVDSLRVLNNIFMLGNAADTDDAQAVIRTPAANSSLKLRLSGNYISDAIVSGTAAGKWLFTTGYAALSLSQLADTLALYNSGVYVPVKNYRATGWGIGGYDYLTEGSDTTRFGGYTGAGSQQTGIYASIGPSQFGYAPLLWTSGAVQGRPSTATLQGPWDALSLVNKGVLTTSSATDPDTWFEIPRIYDESSMAVARSFLDAWEAWPAANQAKVRFKVSGEPVMVITSADSTYQTIGQLVNALAGNVAAETAADSLTASTWFSLPRPYNLNAAFQIEIARAWWRVLPDSSKVRIRFRVSGTDFSMASPDSSYANGLWAASKAIGAAAETDSDSLTASTWFMLPRVYDMAQAQQAGIYRDGWAGWPLARQQEVRMKTK